MVTTPETFPSAPTALSAASAGATHLVMKWTAPSSNGDAIMRYNVEVNDNPMDVTATFRGVGATDGPSTLFEIRNLKPISAYAVRVLV